MLRMIKKAPPEKKETSLTVRLRASDKALIERQAAEEMRSIPDHLAWLARQHEAAKGGKKN